MSSDALQIGDLVLFNYKYSQCYTEMGLITEFESRSLEYWISVTWAGEDRMHSGLYSGDELVIVSRISDLSDD